MYIYEQPSPIPIIITQNKHCSVLQLIILAGGGCGHKPLKRGATILYAFVRFSSQCYVHSSLHNYFILDLPEF